MNTISLKAHKTLNEPWIHQVIADHPDILGLGDIVVKDRERLHPGAGRLDMLLQDAEGIGRYEVEIQLGPTDPSHIIRTIEYWDIERKRYPQYDHTAVIVAEEITSRFLNVIGLFNGSIPLIALQMRALQVGDDVSLQFTKVVDVLQRGLVDEDEPVNVRVTRSDWEKKANPKSVALADTVLDLAKSFSNKIELSYNKYYIGFKVDGKAINFATMKPQSASMLLEIAIPKTEETDAMLTNQGLETLSYDKTFSRYPIRLTAAELSKHQKFIVDLLRMAYDRRMAS
ncbi:MAG TPA: hypothetical protein PLV70_09760 [Flavobacteriales bacterium]|nr:hypothetical protein [Flavobacteriales bacterium]HRP82420.1 hypothetical protein [Flavobacteriales bacterium]HRQ85384.1 hypothetical protein [Flavobacteriales bacterium]